MKLQPLWIEAERGESQALVAMVVFRIDHICSCGRTG